MNGDAAPEAERPEPATASLVRNFLVIAIALLLLKLLLVSQREIVPEQHDAEAYASASLYDLRLIFFDSAGHPPGAPLVMALARSLGIPYRVFIEVFLAVAAFLFFRPLVASMRLGMIAVTLSYGVLLFHPSLILEMDRAMSDSVSFFCWLMGAGGIIGFVAAPREKLPRWSLGLVIVSFAFAGITRSGEGTIILVEMVAVALLSILLFRGLDGWRRRRAVVACLCAVAANFAAVQALSAAHYLKNGYWGASAVESREWWQLYSTLLSLPVERNDRYVLVNKATMDMAESFSGDLRNIGTCIQQVEASFSTEELPNYGVPWVITGCLEETQTQYAKMRTMSADIHSGALEHHLHLSAPLLGIIPQPAVQWLADLPSSIIEVARDGVQIPGSTHVAQDSWKAELFDRALLRRTALVATGENPEVFGYKPFIRSSVHGPRGAFLAFGPHISCRRGRHCHALSANHDQNQAHRLRSLRLGYRCALQDLVLFNCRLDTLGTPSPLHTWSKRIDCRHSFDAPDSLASARHRKCARTQVDEASRPPVLAENDRYSSRRA